MRRRFMRETTRAIDALLARLPAGDPRRARAQRLALKYNRDCGCGVGALALGAAIPLTCAYLALTGVTLVSVAAGIAFDFGATLAGKAMGLALATVRLALLRRSLARTPGLQRLEVGHVDLH
jgi:hypothetical protein